jgi:aminoglycoside 6'-N-acetyltransferase
MRLRGDRITLRPAGAADAGRLIEILAAPGVVEWWGPHTAADVAALLTEPSFMIEHAEQSIGLIQWYEEDDPDYRHAGMDLALHPDWHGRGLGSEAVRVLARWLVTERGHHRLVIDPAAANHAAIRCYRRVGFRPVGVLRRYERGTDGTWHDGLLLDLLAEELT